MTDEKKEYEKDDDEDDIQELREVLEVVSERVPKLIKEIVDAVYNNQDPDEYGRSVASFYKQLTDAGMDPKEAYKLTEKFMDSRDLPSLISKIIEKEGGLHIGGREGINFGVGKDAEKNAESEEKEDAGEE